MYKFWILFIFTALTVKGQNDSLINFTELTFNSDFEHKIFQHFDSASTKILNLMLASSGLEKETEIARYVTEYNKLVSYFKQKRISNKSLQNQVKVIFKHVHSKHFKLYNEEVNFKEIFDSGHYNCVTASALFAMLFENFGIPYEIIELPSHVYLLADPAGQRITVESTAPQNGYNLYDEKYRRQYVEYLRKNKLMTDTERSDYLNNMNPEEETISISQLIGLQYYNNGVFLMSKEDYDKSTIELEKAAYIYDSPRIRLMLCSVLGVKLNNLKRITFKDVQLLGRMYYLLKGLVETNDLIKNDFLRITFEILEESNNRHEYVKSYALLSQLLDSAESKIDLESIYTTELGRNYAQTGDYDSAFVHISRALHLKPSNVRVQSLFEAVSLEIVRNQDDPLASINLLDSLTKNHSFLASRLLVKQTSFSLHCYAAIRFYGIDDRKRGDAYLNTATVLFSDVKWNRAQDAIAAAYYEAWRSYIRANNKSMGTKIAKKGLLYAPYNENLNRAAKY